MEAEIARQRKELQAKGGDPNEAGSIAHWKIEIEVMERGQARWRARRYTDKEYKEIRPKMGKLSDGVTYFVGKPQGDRAGTMARVEEEMRQNGYDPSQFTFRTKVDGTVMAVHNKQSLAVHDKQSSRARPVDEDLGAAGSGPARSASETPSWSTIEVKGGVLRGEVRGPASNKASLARTAAINRARSQFLSKYPSEWGDENDAAIAFSKSHSVEQRKDDKDRTYFVVTVEAKEPES